uniref:ClpN n=1 Tax=Mallomonas splendens TaxID=52552 RepID=A0A3G2QZC8_9STRA|nr:ClpN [Mallomonas splendens]AYO28498.1 ClpN [Mallomonas splendens]
MIQKITKFFKTIFFENKDFSISNLKNDEKTLSPKYFKNYIDPTKTKEEKIKLEKRRRSQGYLALDYLLNLTTYFDFYSFDAFQIVTLGKEYSAFLKTEYLSSDFLLYSFFSTNSSLLEILKDFSIFPEDPKKELKEKEISIPNFFNFLSLKEKEIEPVSEISFSRETFDIFEKSIENALNRFKTPVVSTEILFITMMEQENSKVQNLIQSFLNSETDWYLLRYKLIKRLHRFEAFIRTEIPINQHYFAYLLKIQLSDLEFEQLVETNQLLPAISIFRNEIISETININIHEIIEKEIMFSLKNFLTDENPRTYY